MVLNFDCEPEKHLIPSETFITNWYFVYIGHFPSNYVYYNVSHLFQIHILLFAVIKLTSVVLKLFPSAPTP